VPDGLFDGVLARGEAAAAVGDRAWLQAMLDVEAGLARAEASAGLIAPEDAEAIARACVAEEFDAAALGAAAASSGNPVVPLARALSERVGGDAAGQVHRGATSQDVLDSAAMLVARRALAPLLADLWGAADAAARLAAEHRSTPMAGRTLLQQAVPVTFGLVAAGWLNGVGEAATRLEQVRAERLAVQLGGASGTLAALGDDGPAVLAALARELDLAEPVLPWHADRGRIAELAGALGGAAGAVAKAAGDVVLLAQTELGEVHEDGDRGGSSTMPHKRNAVAAISARACARQAPGLVATLLAAGEHELQRAAGAWHAEWRPFSELLRSTGSAAAWLRDALEHLRADPEAMRANLDRTGGLPLAERVARALAGTLGREAAHDRVREAALDAARSGRPFAEALQARGVGDAAGLLDPAGYLGSAEAFVDRALAAHARRRP
jgi:3-carboxy-cis,cis-muconate cycloisomerase